MSEQPTGISGSADDSAPEASDAGAPADGSDSKLDGQTGAASEQDEDREERLRKNREKARDRRNRKKALIEDMQRNVVVLSKMNSELKKKNADLLGQLARYGAAGQAGDILPVDVSQMCTLCMCVP